MYPKWDDDVDDPLINNIIRFSFEEGWKWQPIHWPLEGVEAPVSVKTTSFKTESGSILWS